MLFALQRIRQLEDMIEMQKRQVKEIEEKVDICHVEFLRFNVVGHGSMKTDFIFF